MDRINGNGYIRREDSIRKEEIERRTTLESKMGKEKFRRELDGMGAQEEKHEERQERERHENKMNDRNCKNKGMKVREEGK